MRTVHDGAVAVVAGALFPGRFNQVAVGLGLGGDLFGGQQALPFFQAFGIVGGIGLDAGTDFGRVPLEPCFHVVRTAAVVEASVHRVAQDGGAAIVGTYDDEPLLVQVEDIEAGSGCRPACVFGVQGEGVAAFHQSFLLQEMCACGLCGAAVDRACIEDMGGKQEDDKEHDAPFTVMHDRIHND